MTFFNFNWIKQVPDSPKTLVAVHPVSGSIMRLYGLAKGLNMSVGGLQSDGVNPGTVPFNSISAMADKYLRELTEVDTQFTYLLGYCWGGLVAYEMVKQGFASKLILIDPPVPLDSITGDEITAERLANREKPKDPPPFDKIIVSHWDAANAYRPEPMAPLPEALIIWCADTFQKMIQQRAELHPSIWNQHVNATHIVLQINQKDLFVGDNLIQISNIIEGY